MPTTTELNKSSVQLEHEGELKADAVAKGMDTCETISVSDQCFSHLSSDFNVKPKLIVKHNSGDILAVRQRSETEKQ
ncbi:unnamed protein product [Trichobilharzia regenti]|nr:unnamed protein product [Trichobilharzia regenti]